MLIFVSKTQSFIIIALRFYLTGGILFNYFSGLLFNYIIQSDILGLSDEDKSKLENGYTIEWDAEKQKFVVNEIEVFGKIEW